MVHLSVFKGQTCWLLGVLTVFVSDSKRVIVDAVRKSQTNKKRDTERKQQKRHDKRRKRQRVAKVKKREFGSRETELKYYFELRFNIATFLCVI